MNPNLSFFPSLSLYFIYLFFFTLFHTNNDCVPWGRSDKRAKGARVVGWCEEMSALCHAIREVTSVPQQLFLSLHHPLDEIIFVNILSNL